MTLKPDATPGDTRWFTHDRFGLFIHWGTYALGARHEWVKSREQIPDDVYQKYFDHFDPDLYNPDDVRDPRKGNLPHQLAAKAKLLVGVGNDAYELVPCPDCGGQGIAHCCDGSCEQPAIEVLKE